MFFLLLFLHDAPIPLIGNPMVPSHDTLLFVLLDSLVPLSCDAPLPCDFCHAPLLNIPVAPSQDAPFAHASWWSNCSKM
jgi:hypothetical protein